MGQAEQNRKRMPNVANIVDELRAEFGSFKVVAAEDFETGIKIGSFHDEDTNHVPTTETETPRS